MADLILGLTGKATCGKDTLFNLLKQELGADYNVERFSVADMIRTELNSLEALHDLGIDCFKLSGPEKEEVRPLMVALGNLCRKRTEGKYFTKMLGHSIRYASDDRASYGDEKPTISVVTDIRFCQYPEDETFWLRQKNGGKLVYINRYTQDMFGIQSDIPFVNDMEKSQDEGLRNEADLTIHWPTISNREELSTYAQELITKIKQDWLPL